MILFLQRKKEKIKLRDIDIDRIITSPSFQKILNEKVQVVLKKIEHEKKSKSLKKDKPNEEIYEVVTKSVLKKILDKITDKIFWGSGIAATGVILSGLNVSNDDGSFIGLDDIDYTKLDWSTIDWTTIDFASLDPDWLEIVDDVMGEGSSNFIRWFADKTINLFEE